jgi:biopolymer transport protein ExbD
MARHKTVHTAPIDPDLPIVPMLDMCFQLLAFFIMTFNPTPTEGHLDLALPKLTGGDTSVTPTTPSIDEDDEFTVQVDSTPEGGIASINVLEKGAAAAKPLGTDTGKLYAYLKERTANKGGKVGKLRMELGETLNYQYVIKLIDESSRAGYKQVSPTPIGGGGK